MGHFAHITGLSAYTDTVSGTEVTGFKATVDNVIVAEQDFINTGLVGDPSEWIQTSYNHRIRNVYAGIGYTYDSIKDIFYPPQPYPSWVLASVPEKGMDENYNIVVTRSTYKWVSPVPQPTDGKLYEWNESIKNWEEMVVPSPNTL